MFICTSELRHGKFTFLMFVNQVSSTELLAIYKVAFSSSCTFLLLHRSTEQFENQITKTSNFTKLLQNPKPSTCLTPSTKSRMLSTSTMTIPPLLELPELPILQAPTPPVHIIQALQRELPAPTALAQQMLQSKSSNFLHSDSELHNRSSMLTPRTCSPRIDSGLDNRRNASVTGGGYSSTGTGHIGAGVGTGATGNGYGSGVTGTSHPTSTTAGPHRVSFPLSMSLCSRLRCSSLELPQRLFSH
jgi:hypothetical protein